MFSHDLGRLDPFATPSGNVGIRAKRKTLQKRCAQHLRMTGQAMDLSATHAWRHGSDDWLSGFCRVSHSLFVGGVWPSTRQSGQSWFFLCSVGASEGGRGSPTGERVSRKRKFSRFAAGLRLKIREGHSDESNALRRRECGTDQVKGDLMQLLSRLDRYFHRPTAS